MNEPKVMTITIHNDGRITVNGPLNDKLLCFGMLEAAKDVVRAFDPSKAVIPADQLKLPAGFPPLKHVPRG